MTKLCKQFSFPGGISSHVAPETPGSINEGGELGYSLAHAFGAVFDNPDLIAACVVGGASLTGGVGNAVGVGLGIFVVFVINNIINMIGLSNYWADVFTGCILAGAVMIDIIRQRQKIHA